MYGKFTHHHYSFNGNRYCVIFNVALGIFQHMMPFFFCGFPSRPNIGNRYDLSCYGYFNLEWKWLELKLFDEITFSTPILAVE